MPKYVLKKQCERPTALKSRVEEMSQPSQWKEQIRIIVTCLQQFSYSEEYYV